jgi:hypothetical protein
MALHFTTPGYREFGQRYGEKMRPMMGSKVAQTTQTAWPAVP